MDSSYDFIFLERLQALFIPYIEARIFLAPVILCLILILLFPHTASKTNGFPIHGYESKLEPTWLLRARFILGSRRIIRKGYEKFKNIPFIVRRNDVDMIVLPIKYLEEIRFTPASQLSAKEAQVRNIVPQWTGLDFVLKSNLHVDALNKKLSPELGSFLVGIKDELEYAWGKDVPQPNDWTVVDIQDIVRKLIARASAKIFIGSPTCRDKEWLDVSISFSIYTFITAIVLRLFPTWMHGFVAYLLPTRYLMLRNIAASKRIIGGMMATHENIKERRACGEEVFEEDTLLNWMLDNGTPEETTVERMGTLQCIMTLASIHTTSIHIMNILFDICAHPEWIPELREEIDAIYQDQDLSQPNCDIKKWLRKFEKLDSFQTEALRFNPPIILGPQRIVMKPYTMRDGTSLPIGARVAFPGLHHTFDPEVTPNPHEFDPMRSYRKRKSAPSEANKHQAAQTSMSNLAFGYGNQACPGRFLASAETKMIVARLLHEFDFQFLPGKSRPRTWYADENSFTDLTAKLMMRKRRAV